MKKCPSCKKNVPAGARRCVYCHAVVDGHQSEHSSPEFDFSRNTFSNNSGSDNDYSDRSFDSGYGSNRYNAGPMRTMAGLPGITFNNGVATPNPVFTQASSSAPSESPTPARPVQPISSAPTPARPSEPVSSHAPTPARPSQPVGAESLVAEDDFDPLSGLTGVQAPKVSSLIDEELTDLTEELFGNGFTSFASTDDEEGLDFDFDLAPEPSEPSISEAVEDDDPGLLFESQESKQATEANVKPEADLDPVFHDETQTLCNLHEEDNAAKYSTMDVIFLMLGSLLSISWWIPPVEDSGKNALALLSETVSLNLGLFGLSGLAAILGLIAAFTRWSSKASMYTFIIVGVLLAVMALLAPWCQNFVFCALVLASAICFILSAVFQARKG